jgi:hypothetical protein
MGGERMYKAEFVQLLLVHERFSILIYSMTHHEQTYVTKSTNNYLTAIGDALNRVLFCK